MTVLDRFNYGLYLVDIILSDTRRIEIQGYPTLPLDVFNKVCVYCENEGLLERAQNWVPQFQGGT
jgi:hypothetical protein